MQRSTGLLAAAFGLAAISFGQTPAAQHPAATPQTTSPQATTPKAAAFPPPASSPLTVVNVVVQDKNGRPVHGLKQDSFRLTDDATPQTISRFEEHSTAAPPQPAPAVAPLPPGMFTDFTPIPPNSALNILIFDSLNTPPNDQRALYAQLQDFVTHADPRTHIAIFGLANHLVLLQGFDSDPAALKSVIGHQLIPRSPALARHVDPIAAQKQNITDGAVGNAPAVDEVAANIEEFQHQMASLQTQLRPQITLDAFNTLGHFLSTLPGRKNVLWFSGSFPLNLSPGAAPKEFADLASVDQDELREAAILLATAQASIYPLDARPLLTRGSHSPAAKAARLPAENSKFATTESVERAQMSSIAAATGGKPFFDVNNLSEAVSQAIDNGSNYYALAFTPTNPQADGKYRQIAVDLNGQPSASALQLAYDHGYFAPTAPAPEAPPSASTQGAKAAATPAPVAAYARAAMARGAPAPNGVLFKVRVLPAASVTETKIAPGNTLDPSVSPTGPFRNFNVDYVSLLNELTLHLQPNGRRTGAVEFVVYVYDTDGRLLNAVGKEATLNLSPATYERVVHSAMEFHLQISVPTAQETFLRIGMRDVPTNKFGVVELPVASVIQLNPLDLKAPPLSKSIQTPAAATPPASSTPAPPSTAPSTHPAPAAPNATPPS